MAPFEAIRQACILRFRPIMMTTMAALLGALPLAIGTGTGSELRRPLGIAIVGGLLVSQVLTLYTTPVIYLAFAALRARFGAHAAGPAPLPSRRSRAAMNSRAVHPAAGRDHAADALGMLLLGMVAYMRLPIASLPTVDRPTIRSMRLCRARAPTRSRPRWRSRWSARSGTIPGVVEMRRSAAWAAPSIVIQFDLSVDIDAAAGAVQAAINAAGPDLPKDLPCRRSTGRPIRPASR